MLFSPVTVIYKISILRENLSGAVTCKWGVSSSTWACRGRWRSHRRRGPHTWACASCLECPSPASPSPPARGTSAFLGVCQQQDHRPFFSQMLWYLLQGCSSVPGIANGIIGRVFRSYSWFLACYSKLQLQLNLWAVWFAETKLNVTFASTIQLQAPPASVLSLNQVISGALSTPTAMKMKQRIKINV